MNRHIFGRPDSCIRDDAFDRAQFRFNITEKTLDLRLLGKVCLKCFRTPLGLCREFLRGVSLVPIMNRNF